MTETTVFISELLHPDDITYHMKVGKFLSALTRTQQEDFSEIIAINNKLLLDLPKKYSQFLQPSFPMTNQFINSVYMRGKYSMLKNLPRPIVKVMDEHAYVSLQDIVAPLLAFNDSFTVMHNEQQCNSLFVQKVTESRAVLSIRDRAASTYPNEEIITLHCTEWSDDFDHNECFQRVLYIGWKRVFVVRQVFGVRA